MSLIHIREAMVLFNGGFGASAFGGIATPFGFLLKVLCAVQAARFFTEARREGVLETLLCAPLTSRDLVSGQLLALRRLFGPAIAVYVVVLFIPGFLQLISAWMTVDFPRLWGGAFSFFLSLVYCVRVGADLVAVSLVAMWLALSLRKPNYAPVLTILYVLVLPSFLCWLDLFADFVFIVWASARLHSDVRWILSRQYTVPTPPTPCPPVIAQSAAPPGLT